MSKHDCWSAELQGMLLTNWVTFHVCLFKLKTALFLLHLLLFSLLSSDCWLVTNIINVALFFFYISRHLDIYIPTYCSEDSNYAASRPSFHIYCTS